VTKASELHGKIACKLADGRTLAARLVRVWEEHDLAMLKVEAADLPAIQWADGKVAVGQWVASAGTGALPIAVGVISVGRRRIPARSGMLGIMLGDVPDGLRVMQVVPDSAAARAGIQLDDVILALNGKPTPTREELAHVIADCPSGQTVKVLLRRGDKEVEVNATLGVRTPTTQSRRADMQNTLAGPVSKRASSFPAVLQHDTVLKPGECGGPLVDLDGKIVGLNIARAGRVESYATPADVVKSVVAQLKSPRPATTAATSKPR
jgi:serine protease Do